MHKSKITFIAARVGSIQQYTYMPLEKRSVWTYEWYIYIVEDIHPHFEMICEQCIKYCTIKSLVSETE